MTTEVVYTAATFEIHETTGDQRTVRLNGRALPYRPFSLSGSQRVETTWYPGNPEATATVLGAREEPTRLTGYWKDRFLGELDGDSSPLMVDFQRVDNVRDAARLIDDIRRKGQLLKVTWDEQVRLGHLTRFDQDWHNVHDLEWKMEFAWIGFDEVPGAPSYTQGHSVSETADVMEQQQTALATAATRPFAMDDVTAAAISDRVSAITASAAQVAAMATNLELGASTPFDAARRTIAVMTAVIAQSRDLVVAMEAQPARAFNGEAPLVALTMGQILEAAVYVRGVIDAARAMLRAAVIRRSSLVESVHAQLAGTYVAKANDDLRTVSQLFYGTPFLWRNLLVFNELTSSALTAGQLVLVPQQSQGGV